MIPLGGFVSIPGMIADPHDAERRFPRAVAEAPALAGPVDRVKPTLEVEDFEGAMSQVDDSMRRCERRRCRLAPMLLPRKV